MAKCRPIYRGGRRHRTDMTVVIPITLSCRPRVLPGHKVTWNTSTTDIGAGTDTDLIGACTAGLIMHDFRWEQWQIRDSGLNGVSRHWTAAPNGSSRNWTAARTERQQHALNGSTERQQHALNDSSRHWTAAPNGGSSRHWTAAARTERQQHALRISPGLNFFL